MELNDWSVQYVKCYGRNATQRERILRCEMVTYLWMSSQICELEMVLEN